MISTSAIRRRAVPTRTPHVPPDEIALEAQNRSEVKVEQLRKITLQSRRPGLQVRTNLK